MRSPAAWGCVRASDRAVNSPRSRTPDRALARPARRRAVVAALWFAGVAAVIVFATSDPPPVTAAAHPAADTTGSLADSARAGAAGAGTPAPSDSLPRDLPFDIVSDAALIANGVASGELVEPAGLAIDAFGRLFVADAALHRLQRFDARGARTGEAGALGSDLGQLRRPGSVALLGTLSVAVLDVENRRVALFDVNARPQGILIDFDDPDLRSALGRIEPRGLASDRGGAVYVVDGERDRLLVFDFSGRYTRTIGGFGDTPGSFRELAAVAASRRGELVTVERARRRVQRLDAAGAPAAAWTLPGAAEAGAMAVAVDDSLRVAVASERAGTVTLWDRGGRPLAGLRGLDRPRALAFAPGGTLVVAEAGNGRLTRFRIEPRPHPER